MSLNKSDQPSEILLSICFPTYNQPEAATAFLESVRPQLTPEVEILILDDSPDECTRKAVAPYLDDRIQYSRGEGGSLKGLDRALLVLLERARGRYVWTFGDEILENGAIQKILSLLKTHPDLSLIWVNSRDENNTSIAFDFKEDRFFRDADEMIEVIGMELTFISATVFNRAKALKGLRLAEKYIGTTYVHIYLVLTAMSQGGRFYFVNHPYVVGVVKPPEFQYNFNKNVFKVTTEDLFRVVNSPDFKGKFSRKSIRRFLSVQFGRIWRGVLVARALGHKNDYASFSSKISTFLKYYWNFPEIFLAVPLLCFPPFLDRFFYRLYRKIFSKT